MKSPLSILFRLVWVIALIVLAAQPTLSKAAPLADETIPPVSGDGPLAAAVMQALHGHQEVAAFALDLTRIERIEYAPDGSQALVYLEELNPQTGQVYAREPGLAVARKASGDVEASAAGADAWQVTLQADNDFTTQLQALPEELLGDDLRQRFLAPQSELDAQATPVKFGGYLLPWAGGVARELTWSVSHASCGNNAAGRNICLYAFDFADGTKFPLLAAKGGEVFAAVWNWPNGDPSHTNYLILKDNSTIPTSYQVYYHLVQNSIPEALRKPGTVVKQGQYIGNADDTGYSTDDHLHFMVHTSSYGYWGDSVDITFRDVSINYDAATGGGRPRMVKETSTFGGQGQDWYTSGNYGSNPPTGGLSAPADGITLNGKDVTVSGWGTDDLGVTKLQVIANYDGTWREVGPAQTASPFTAAIDLCAAGVPDGPVTLALKVWDVEGNPTLTPLTPRNLLKQAGCPAPRTAPVCTPNADQAALYAEPGYGGACQLLGVGDYPNGVTLGNVGADAASSIKVGANVSATLYRDPDFKTRAETFTADDSNLSDNRVGTRSVSAVKVKLRSDRPAAPILSTPGISSGGTITSNDSLVLSWANGAGATKFATELYRGPVDGNPDYDFSGSLDPAKPYSPAYQGNNAWSVGSLPPGNYTWRVQGRIADQNKTQYYSDWSTTAFTVSPGASSPAATGFPYAIDFQNGAPGWTASGLWRQATVRGAAESETTAWVFNNGTNYADPTYRAGDLTTPPITLPSSGPYYLRFAYRYQTEAGGRLWDQRRVQISKNDGPFTDLLQLSDDPMQTWLNAVVAIPADYAGTNVRLRFHFDTVDPLANGYEGWWVDDVRVSGENPGAGDDGTEASIAYGNSVSKEITPPGDIDTYIFSGKLGDVVLAEGTSGLALSILDADRVSVLSGYDPNDARVGRPNRAGVRLPADGNYLLRVISSNHPSGTSPYTLTLNKVQDGAAPTISLSQSGQSGYLPGTTFQLAAQASDNAGGSGVSRVEFYYHTPDWVTGRWASLGVDWNGADGWTSAPLDPSALEQTGGYALWARAVDWAGNTASAVAWNQTVDHTSPVVSLGGLPGQLSSTAVGLAWSGYDNLSGLSQVQLQFQPDGGDWKDGGSYSAAISPIWFVGEFGHTYAFRLQAVDRAGNVRPFPGSPEATVSLVAPANGDGYEADGAPGQAGPVVPDGDAQTHTFYGVGDEDWLWFDAQAGKTYVVRVTPTGPLSAAAAKISLSTDGVSSLGEAAPVSLGQASSLGWKAPADGRVYLKLSSINAQVTGSDVAYRVSVQIGYRNYLPSIVQGPASR